MLGRFSNPLNASERSELEVSGVIVLRASARSRTHSFSLEAFESESMTSGIDSDFTKSVPRHLHVHSTE